jgi:hypothetical protein
MAQRTQPDIVNFPISPVSMVDWSDADEHA